MPAFCRQIALLLLLAVRIHAGRELPPIDVTALAIQSGPAILVVKAWDELGSELASGCGFFVSADGRFAADAKLINDAIVRKIHYFTAVSGDGTAYRVTTVLATESTNNLILLQVAERGVPFLPVSKNPVNGFPLGVAIAGRVEEKDLVLADAQIVGAREVLGKERWLELIGADSSGTPGSPVLDGTGAVVAVITLHVPEQRWLNFAVPAYVVQELVAAADAGGKPVSLKRLAATPSGGIVADSEFMPLYEALLASSNRRALELARNFSERHPRSGEAWGLLGLALTRNGQGEDAMRAFEKAIGFQPENPEIWSRLAVAYRSQGMPDAAFAAFQEVVKRKPDDRLAWYLIGERHIRRGEFPEAAAALAQATLLDPTNAKALYLLGFTQSKAGNLLAAEGAFLKAVQARKDYAQGWFALGLVYSKEKRPRQAAAAFEQVVKFEPAHAHAWLNLAHAYRDSGESTAARKAFRRHAAR